MEQVLINSFVELTSFFESVPFPNSTIYRGHANSNWLLLPKSGRPEYFNQYSPQLTEKGAFEAWKRYATHYIHKEPINDWDWLALAQHHGLATRLLDWTKNPLTATFFAVSEAPDIDGVIYLYEIEDANNPAALDPFSFKGFSVFFPKGTSARILSQRGLFTISSTPNIPLTEILGNRIRKVIIRKQAKQSILKTLDNYGVNPLTIFQDLDGLSDYLNSYLLRIVKRDRTEKQVMLPTDLPMG